MEEGQWYLAKVDGQGRITLNMVTKEFLGLKPREIIYVMVKKTGRFSMRGMGLSIPPGDEKPGDVSPDEEGS